jgi:hypothetical protein
MSDLLHEIAPSRFFDSNEEALADMERLANEEARNEEARGVQQ